MGLPNVWRAALTLLALVGLASCSSSDDDEAATTTTASEPAVEFEGRSPTEIAPPAEEGNGTVVPQPSAPVPEGYVEEEYLVGGTATSFDAVDTPDDGFWVAEPGEESEYRTRVIVRRPSDPADFSGTVLLEWFNVSAIESSPDWAYLSQEIASEGHAYIGVSAQAQGVEGGETLIDVEVSEEDAAGAGVSTDTSGLKNVDPERYGSLTHPGDAYSYDIFTQVARAASESPEQLLGELEPTRVIGAGESQSAAFVSTLVNAVHPLDPVFDGFLVHSRVANAAPLDGEVISDREAEDAQELMERAVLIRTDLEVPVLVFEAETDLTLLGYANARQPDTDLLRTWEVAGTAHADAHPVRVIVGGPRDPGLGSLVGCTDPINTGPHHEVLQAAFHQLVEWTAGGPPPPSTKRLELADGDEPAIARDDMGNAIGGVRNPLVDVPVATLSGDPAGGGSIEELAEGEGTVCVLFGTTIPFDRDTLLELYGSADSYVEQFRAAAAEAVEAGHLLQYDADELIAEAEANRALFE